MAELVPTLPAIHLALIGGADPALERFVGFGAEEEGVPTRLVKSEAADLAAVAYAAARSSAFGVGIAIGHGRIALHEGHMPPDRPVLAEGLGAAPASVARRYGANAARLVVRLPFRVDDAKDGLAESPIADAAVPEPRSNAPSETDIAAIIARVVARLKQKETPR